MALSLDVTGAFLGTPLSILAVGAALTIPLHRHLPPQGAPVAVARLRDLLLGAWAPVLGLTLLFVLQEVHIIVIKHEASDDAAGSWAVAAVAAKAIIWVAVGLGLYLLPESARRAHVGVDARPVLVRTLGLIAVLGVPMVLLYAVAGEPLLRIVFGDDLTDAASALPWLGAGDDPAGLQLPVGAVPAGAGPGGLHRAARGGRRGRRWRWWPASEPTSRRSRWRSWAFSSSARP